MLDLIASDLFRNAVIVGTIAAVTSALVGYFVVLRAQAFAGEALTDICFAGSAGAALAGFNPLLGMLAFSLTGALGLGLLSNRARGRDVEIGMALSMATGLENRRRAEDYFGISRMIAAYEDLWESLTRA